jgi:acyl-coenzyme A thioesterase PaaI-like protein
MPRMTAAEIDQLLAASFPQAGGSARSRPSATTSSTAWSATSDAFLRPGGTLSGPTLMTLADTAMYFLVLAMTGPQPLAVTSSLTINFLRKPPPADLYATARMLKLGARLAVGEVHLRGGDHPGVLVAQASVTYALPASA